MTSSGYNADFVPLDVSVDDSMIRVRFTSGLEVATPVSRFPRLMGATPEQRKVWRLIGRGDGIHWPEVDEDISVRGLFAGVRPVAPSAMEEIPALIGDLYKTTGRLNEIFQGRPFTPDGHLVGSIGEVVAEYVYGLSLQPCSTPRVDAHTQEGRSVQIKLTGENGTSYGVRWSSNEDAECPELLICLKLTRKGFEEVYNGPFPVELLRGKKDQSNGQVNLSAKRLQALNPHTVPQKHKFESINRWFTPQLSDVA